MQRILQDLQSQKILNLGGKKMLAVLLRVKDLIGSSGLFLSIWKIYLMIVSTNCINVSILLLLSDNLIQ